jgi:hypothetical protein
MQHADRAVDIHAAGCNDASCQPRKSIHELLRLPARTKYEINDYVWLEVNEAVFVTFKLAAIAKDLLNTCGQIGITAAAIKHRDSVTLLVKLSRQKGPYKATAADYEDVHRMGKHKSS